MWGKGVHAGDDGEEDPLSGLVVASEGLICNPCDELRTNSCGLLCSVAHMGIWTRYESVGVGTGEEDMECWDVDGAVEIRAETAVEW